MHSSQEIVPNKETTVITNSNVESLPSNTLKKTNQKKLPVIKQTKTSMFRIAKANPWLLLKDDDDQKQENDFGLRNIKLPKSIFQLNRNLVPNDNTLSSTKESNKVGLTRTTSVRVKTQKPSKDVQVAKNKLYRSNSVRVQAPKQQQQQNVLNQNGKPAIKKLAANTQNNGTKDKKPVVRRSLSAAHYDKKKLQSQTVLTKNEVTQSLNDITKQPTIVISPKISPIPEKCRTVSFKTPLNINNRRRTGNPHTQTPFQRRQSTPFATPSQYRTGELWDRLQSWLRNNKKSMGNFHHLKCFGLNEDNFRTELDENKENIEKNIVCTSSYDDLNILSEDEKCQTNEEPEIDACAVAQNALRDLHNLILENFPHDQCEAWLQMIKQKYHTLEEDPLYWECRAALEQSRGNITSAVECYKTAIVHGAQVSAVDRSLEHLLQQFSLLNISISDSVDDKTKRDRVRIIQDARNVFKSSIIQFAVQERLIKKKGVQGDMPEKKFIATPVRRSTRKSNSIYASTPGVQLYSSLQDLNDSVRTFMSFQSNKALTFK